MTTSVAGCSTTTFDRFRCGVERSGQNWSSNIERDFGEPEWIIAFESRGHFGNVIRVDNINLAPLWFGMEEPAIPGELNVFPNPAQDRLHVRATHLAAPGALRILDAAGREVRATTVRASSGAWSGSLDVSGLADGVYILKLANAVATFTVHH